jgi:hypothetical protein
MLKRRWFCISRAIELGIDHVQYAGGVLHDVVIPEADNAISLGLEPARAPFVAQSIGLLAVLRSIDFDNKA